MTCYRIFDPRSSTSLVLRGSDGDASLSSLVGLVTALEERLLQAPPLPAVMACSDVRLLLATCLAAWHLRRTVFFAPNHQAGTLQALHVRDDLGPVIHDGCFDAGIDIRTFEATARASELTVEVAADQTLVALSTSGTTGAEQPVTKTAKQLLGEADELAATFGLGSSDVFASSVPPHHIYGLLFGVLLPLRAGATLITRRPLHAEALAAVLETHRATVLVSTPAHLRGLEALEPARVQGLRRVFSSGAPLHPDVARIAASRLQSSITEVFGSTETGGIATRQSAGEEPADWQILGSVEVRTDDDGRMLVRSPFCHPHDRDESDQRAWHVGDDLIELVDARHFRHRGRVDDIVKIAGKRVSLVAVTERLLAHPKVRDAAVIVAGGEGGRVARLQAAFVGSASIEELRAHLAAVFDPVVVPRRLVAVDALPRTAAGKLPRAALAAVFRATTEDTMSSLSLQRLPDEGDRVRYAVNIEEGSRFFDGHFPGHPVLPGAVQLQCVAVPAVAAAWPELGEVPSQIRRLKFKRMIGPGERLEVQLRRRDRRVYFDLLTAEGSCAEGIFVYDRELVRLGSCSTTGDA